MIATVTFFGGLVGLLVAGHIVVEGSSRLGRLFGLPETVVGLTIVAAGTSAPELAVVLQSVLADDTDLAVGSIIGSNIANVLLVLGLAACFGTIRVTNRVVRVDIPIMIGASGALLTMTLDGNLDRLDGVLLFVALLLFVTWTLRANRGASQNIGLPDETTEQTSGDEGHSSFARAVVPSAIRLVIGVGGLALAADLVVSGAKQIAVGLGVPELIVGLTVVALGTSAPEVVTTVIAAVQGRRELAVGNAVGSNIFNIFLVLGLSTAIAPGGIAVDRDAVQLDLPIMVAAAVACLPMVFWDRKFDRWEGIVFVTYYIAYLAFLTLDATGSPLSRAFAIAMAGFVGPLLLLTVIVGLRHRREVNRRATPGPVPAGEVDRV
ncbi:MAG: calcium/sodium antiporter [Actinomycetota bacterium]